jgi:TetR/AcrR family transcriptional regulator, regulator of cefoperazone and chloramphenicol sensitivity
MASTPRPTDRPRRTRGSGRDHLTRRRLLDRAAELFADRGFDAVTVREICGAAGANVAAINYHFGDKAGLYGEVVDVAIAAMRETAAAAIQAAESAPPEERLRAYVRVFLERLMSRGRDSWIHRLMSRELEAPTPALDRVVDQVLRPRIAFLAGIVADLMKLPASDARVGRTVASIQGQCLLYRHHAVVSRLMPSWRPTPERLLELTDHITRFSLGGIEALRDPSGPVAEARR